MSISESISIFPEMTKALELPSEINAPVIFKNHHLTTRTVPTAPIFKDTKERSGWFPNNAPNSVLYSNGIKVWRKEAGKKIYDQNWATHKGKRKKKKYNSRLHRLITGLLLKTDKVWHWMTKSGQDWKWHKVSLPLASINHKNKIQVKKNQPGLPAKYTCHI